MTALHILHITRADSLPPWWNEWQLQQIAAEVPCTAELVTKAEQMADEVVFGSKEWFAAIPEREF